MRISNLLLAAFAVLGLMTGVAADGDGGDVGKHRTTLTWRGDNLGNDAMTTPILVPWIERS